MADQVLCEYEEVNATSNLSPIRCVVQRGAACLPVTAVHTIQHHRQTLLCSNEGSSLLIRSMSGATSYCRRRIFQSQTIHGIVSLVVKQHDAHSSHYLVVWGGRMVRICRLDVEGSDGTDEELRLRLIAPQPLLLGDWVLTVVLDQTHSAAVLLTAHNVLWNIPFDQPGETAPTRIGQGVRTLLYSGCIAVLDDNRVLVASGTAFGEIFVWVCCRSTEVSQATSTIRHVFLGHRGSIFGVDLSNCVLYQGRQRRLLASCSDDRTIRIWDVTDCEASSGVYCTPNEALMGTGFATGSDQETHLVMTWAHLSRIWGVRFVLLDPDQHGSLHLISYGEDGVCQNWGLEYGRLWRESPDVTSSLKLFAKDRHHAGKNIWSIATDPGKPSSTLLYTGGADGRIVSRDLMSNRNTVREFATFDNIVQKLSQLLGKTLWQYLILQNGAVIASTDRGELIQSSVKDYENFSLVFQSSATKTVTLCHNEAHGQVLFCLSNGEICLYDVSDKIMIRAVCTLPTQAVWLSIVHSRRLSASEYAIDFVANFREGLQPRMVRIWRNSNQTTTKTQDLRLPRDFVVTSALYDRPNAVLLCGSKSGALAIFSNFDAEEGSTTAPMIMRHVHGSDSVTSILLLPQDPSAVDSQSTCVLSTGRDGKIVIHQVRSDELGSSYDCLHCIAPRFGSKIEGAYISSTGTSQQALVLYGFQSRDFVVWNESRQTKLFSTDCGGSHRNWSLSPLPDDSGAFVCTKARCFQYYRIASSAQVINQDGGHGREIKALAVSPTSHLLVSSDTQDTSDILVATGAEDTEIRLFRYTTSSITLVSVLQHHTTGLQALQFSSCGRYLFSSGGVDEFSVWRLNRVPVIGIGVVAVATLDKDKEDTEVRITNFDVVRQGLADSHSATFVILIVCSNGKAKIFEFAGGVSSNTGQLELVTQIHFGTLCLTQAKILLDVKSPSVLVGGTDGFLRLTAMSTQECAVVKHCVHQSNIAAMSVLDIGARCYAIATGGDDNAISLTVLQLGADQAKFTTMTIANGHAAAVTAVAMIDMRNKDGKSIYLVSAGNDQKLYLWHLVNLSKVAVASKCSDNDREIADALDGVHPVKVGGSSIDVADVSNLEVVRKRNEIGSVQVEVLVVGVGMQTLSLQILDDQN